MDRQLNCPLCEDQFTDHNLPRLLTKCGHTFCQNCLKKIITQKKGSYKLVCPEDGQMLTLKDNNLNNFPKNMALMKFIEMKKNNQSQQKESNQQISKICKTEQNQQDQEIKDIVQITVTSNNIKQLSRQIRIQNTTKVQVSQVKQQKQQKQQKPQKVEKVQKVQKQQKQQKQEKIQKKQEKNQKKQDKIQKQQIEEVKPSVIIPIPKKQQKQLCKTHGKPLQIVCIIDLKKICANCAIFGEHKGHDFKSFEQIEKQRVQYYHAILSIMQKKQTIAQRISCQQTCSSIMQILQKKKQNMSKQINQKYETLISILRSKQKQSMKNLQKVIEKTQSKVKNLMKIDKKTLEKYDKWEQKSYKQIKILQSNNFQSKLELLFAGTINEGDVLEEGDGIIEQMYKQQENLITEVQLALQNIGVDYNQDIFNNVDGFVQLYDQKKKKNKTIIPQTTQTSPAGNNNNNYTISKTPPPIQKKSINTSSKIEQSEKVPSKIQSKQTPVSRNSQNNQQSLLQMLEDIQEKKAQNKNYFKQTQPFSMKHTPQKKSQIFELNFGASQKKIQTVLHQFQEFQKKEQQIKRKSPQLTQRSNKKEDSSFLQQKQKPNRKKLASKIKVTEKYEKMLDGLANDQLQTVDFTNAQLGDATIIQICQLINGSKARTVKLIRNKLNDETIQKILPHMNGVITLNLSQNFLTDRSLDFLFNGKDHLQSIKSIILCQNKIIDRKHKAKIDKLKSLDITISV